MTMRFVSIANFAVGHPWQLLCRFSDAGNDDLL
jgi:hypothetical protein